MKRCRACGALVVGGRATRRYCNKRCANFAAGYRRRRRAGARSNHERRECPYCGRDYLPRTGSQIYCQRACRLRLAHFLRCVAEAPARMAEVQATWSPETRAARATSAIELTAT